MPLIACEDSPETVLSVHVTTSGEVTNSAVAVPMTYIPFL
jgi:hypothetical protein